MRQLPERPDLEHLRNEAKQRLKELRGEQPAARLSDAQLLVARDYGFASWRQLKAAVDVGDRRRVFQAARDGDLDAVRRALDHGFHPGTTDESGRTLHQVAKTLGQTPIELLLREYQSVRMAATPSPCICSWRRRTPRARGGSSTAAWT